MVDLSRHLKFRRLIHVAGHTNGRCSRCATAWLFSLMLHFLCCVRAQREILIHRLGSQRTCGGAACGFHPEHSVAGLIGTPG